MKANSFADFDDRALISKIQDPDLGLARAFAIEELVGRALRNPHLLEEACSAVSSDIRIGFHIGAPTGWLGADRIFLSGQVEAIRHLLHAMSSWEATEQEDLVRHWAGKGRLEGLTKELSQQYGWSPKYLSRIES